MLNGAILQFLLLNEDTPEPAAARDYLERLFRQVGLTDNRPPCSGSGR